MKSLKSNPNGDIEIVLIIPYEDREEGKKWMDAYGVDIEVRARRKVYDPK